MCSKYSLLLLHIPSCVFLNLGIIPGTSSWGGVKAL